MPDSKITALASIGTGTDPANDPLVIVDVSDVSPSGMSATGTTKKVTLNNLLACSPTATLASATISGDLTVDTNVLKVDTTLNRVGIGTATPAVPLHILAPGTDTAAIRLAATGGRIFDIGSTAAGYGSANNLIIYDITGSAERYRIDSTGIHTWQNVGGVAGTAMTLNSTGLGVGVSPSYNIHARGTTDGRIQVEGASGFGMVFIQASSGNTAQLQLNSNGGLGKRYVVASNTSGQFLIGDETAVATRLTIDSSGNVISNVTGTAPTLAANSQMVFNLTSNTNLRISVRGTDGTTRTANITLA